MLHRHDNDESLPSGQAVRFRAIAVGLALIPVNAIWVAMMEAIKYTGHPTTYSLYFNAVILLTALTLLNRLVGVTGRTPLSRADLLVIYFMIAVATSLAGHDQAQVLLGVITAPLYKATPENRWALTFGEWLPKYLVPRDPVALEEFFIGHSSFFRHWRAWVVPLGCWAAFTYALLGTFFCINAVLRRQWVEHERLTFPLVALPLEMTGDVASFWKQRMMWYGLLIPVLINLVNNLHEYYPGVTAIGTRTTRMSQFLTTHPWRVIGGTPMFVFPFAIGIGYLLPLDVLGSSWIFFWFWKLQMVTGAATGLTSGHPNAPYIPEQAYGGYLALAAISLYSARRHIGRVVRSAFGLDREYARLREGIPYPLAFWGFAAGFGFLVWFGHQMGMEVVPVIVLFVGYYAISVAVGRLRAEFGSPTHDLHNAYAGELMARILGPRSFSPGTLTGFMLLRWFNRAHRSHPLPVQLEAQVAAGRIGLPQRGMTLALALAALVGLICAYIAVLEPHYHRGADSAKVHPLLSIFGRESWNKLTVMLSSPDRPEPGSLVAMIVGFCTCCALFVCRIRMVGFPLHPVGYAVSSSWSLDQVWLSLLLAWTAKTIIVRYGGLRLYRQAIPFFLGLILGDFLSGGLFNIIGVIWDLPVYHFLG